MATLADFKKRIDAGGAACRLEAWDSALVFRILDGTFNSYYVGGLSNDKAQECFTWDAVIDELSVEWAEASGWQAYRLGHPGVKE
jgi:hypothetical protein